jgi:CHAT domain-containing protein
VVSYNLSSDGGHIILNTGSNTKYFKIQEGSNYIQSKINKLRESMKGHNSEFSFASASVLYEILFKPIEIYLNGVNNIYIYGSSLEDLSFGTLIKNYDDVNVIQNEKKKLLVADWLIKHYSFARIYPLNNNLIHSEFDYKYLGLANPDSFGEIGLSELPNSEDEILQIGLSSQSYSREFLLTKSNASKKNLKEKLENSYERIVFATHAVPPFWNGITSEGALVLDDENGDYFLTATEVVNLDFQSDMVVLSSCSTEEKGSDSIYKSFLVAGANSVMYTNWELETVSASLITDRIFKYILFEEYQKHKALQLASIDIMNDYSNPLYAHPAFWGNFSIAYRSL